MSNVCHLWNDESVLKDGRVISYCGIDISAEPENDGTDPDCPECVQREQDDDWEPSAHWDWDPVKRAEVERILRQAFGLDAG